MSDRLRGEMNLIGEIGRLEGERDAARAEVGRLRDACELALDAIELIAREYGGKWDASTSRTIAGKLRVALGVPDFRDYADEHFDNHPGQGAGGM